MDRLPFHARALELFRQGYDLGSARLIAADEHRFAQVNKEMVPISVIASNQVAKGEPMPTVKFPSRDCKPGRMVGFERGQNG
jgi:hypothetical protein